MASFMTELWESIFTPGPTPTILKATNITFAALQAVLFALLLATYSVHCVVLSVLCAGLWWSVNWFAAELQAVKEEEEAKKKAAKKDIDDSSDTEVEADKVVGGGISSQAEGQVRRRAAGEHLSPAGTQSSASTEDEWEKVSESEKEKEK